MLLTHKGSETGGTEPMACVLAEILVRNHALLDDRCRPEEDTIFSLGEEGLCLLRAYLAAPRFDRIVRKISLAPSFHCVLRSGPPGLARCRMKADLSRLVSLHRERRCVEG